MRAAECLARLGAVSEIVQIQAALERLPEGKDEQDFYKAQLARAIDELKHAKDNKGEQQSQR